MLMAQYLENRWKYSLGSNEPPIGNGPLGFEWSRDWWCHVTQKGQGHDPDVFGPIISKTVRDTDLVQWSTYRKWLAGNGHVTDDVTWPWKIKVVTPICLWLSISKTAGDTALVPMDHQWEMTHWDSNVDVTDDVTWPRKVMSWPRYILCPLSRKRLEIRTWWQWSTYRKWLPGNQMVTWCHSLNGQDHDPDIFGSIISTTAGECRYRICYNGATIGYDYMRIKRVTWPITSRDNERSSLWHLVT